MYSYDEQEPNNESEGYYQKPSDCYYYSTGGGYRPPKPPHNYGGVIAILALCLLCLSVVTVALRRDDNVPNEQSVSETAASITTEANEEPDESGISADQAQADMTDGLMSIDAQQESKDTAEKDQPDNSATVLEITESSAKNDDELSLQEIYKKVIDSVVSITAVGQDSSSTGTGIVMSEDGYIITNYHVVDDASSVSVMLNDGNSYDASVIGGDELSDLMVLKINAENLTAAEFGDSDRVEVGDSVVAIGDPLGTQLRGTMTDGIICGINRDVTVDGRTMTVIQTNAALNSGNSGGPLINMQGQVIGVNAMKMSSEFSSIEGIGFAIPISIAKPIVDELINQGYVSGRPDFGFTVSNLDMRVMIFYNLPGRVCVDSIDADSNAAACGIESGDIVISIDGQNISSTDDFTSIKNNYAAGDKVKVTLYRNGTQFDVELTLQDQAKSN